MGDLPAASPKSARHQLFLFVSLCFLLLLSPLCVAQETIRFTLAPHAGTTITDLKSGVTCSTASTETASCEIQVPKGDKLTLLAEADPQGLHIEFASWEGNFTDEDPGFFNTPILQLDTGLPQIIENSVIESRFIDPEPYSISHPLLGVSYNASPDWLSFDLFAGVEACVTPGNTGDAEKDRLTNPMAQWGNLTVIDLNADGRDDILLPAHCGVMNFDFEIGADRAGYLFSFLQDEKGNFIPSNGALFGREQIQLGDFTGSIHIGSTSDMNSDGYPDVLFKNDRDNGSGDNNSSVQQWWQEHFDTTESYPSDQQTKWMGEQFLMLSSSDGTFEFHQIGWNANHNRAYQDAAGDWYVFTDPHGRAAATKIQGNQLVDVYDEIFLAETDEDNGSTIYNYKYRSNGPHLSKESFSFAGLDSLSATLGVSGFRYDPDASFLELRAWEDDMPVSQGHCKSFYSGATCSGPKVVAETVNSDDFFMIDLGSVQMGLSVYGYEHTGLSLWNFDRITMSPDGPELLFMKIPYTTLLNEAESGYWPLWLVFEESLSGKLELVPQQSHPFFDPSYTWLEQINAWALDESGQFHNSSAEDDRFSFRDLNGDGLVDYTTWRPVTFGWSLMLEEGGYPISEDGNSVIGRNPNGFRYNSVYINNGQGKFVKLPIDAGSYPFPAGTYQQMVTDLNGDGAPDVISLVDFSLRHSLNYRTYANKVGMAINYGVSAPAAAPSRPQVEILETEDRAVIVHVRAEEGEASAVDYFTARCTHDGINWLEVQSSQSPLRLEGLFNGLTYTCEVRAVGLNGETSAAVTTDGFITRPAGSNIYRIALEEPLPDGIHTGVGNLRGWAVATEGVAKIEIFVDGEYKFDAPYGGARRDVGQAFPEIEDANASGYSLAYNYSDLPEFGHSVIAQAHSTNGATFATSAFFNVVKFPEFVRGEGAVKLNEASCQLSDSQINLFNASVLDQIYDMTLEWRPAEQGFEIIDIRGE